MDILWTGDLPLAFLGPRRPSSPRLSLSICSCRDGVWETLWVQKVDSDQPPGGPGEGTTWSQGARDPSCHTGKTRAEGWERPLLLGPRQPQAPHPPLQLAPSLSPRATRGRRLGATWTTSLLSTQLPTSPPPHPVLFSACVSSTFCLQPSFGCFLSPSCSTHTGRSGWHVLFTLPPH